MDERQKEDGTCVYNTLGRQSFVLVWDEFSILMGKYPFKIIDKSTKLNH